MEKQPLKNDAIIDYNSAIVPDAGFPAPYDQDPSKYPLPNVS